MIQSTFLEPTKFLFDSTKDLGSSNKCFVQVKKFFFLSLVEYFVFSVETHLKVNVKSTRFDKILLFRILFRRRKRFKPESSLKIIDILSRYTQKITKTNEHSRTLGKFECQALVVKGNELSIGLKKIRRKWYSEVQRLLHRLTMIHKYSHNAHLNTWSLLEAASLFNVILIRNTLYRIYRWRRRELVCWYFTLSKTSFCLREIVQHQSIDLLIANSKL